MTHSQMALRFPAAGLNLTNHSSGEHTPRTIEDERTLRSCRCAVDSSSSPCTSQVAQHSSHTGAGFHVEFHAVGKRAAKRASLKRARQACDIMNALCNCSLPFTEGYVGLRSRTSYAGGRGNGMTSGGRLDLLARSSATCFQREPSTRGVHCTLSATCQREREDVTAGLPSLGMETQESRREATFPPAKTEYEVLMAHYVPVYVMLPLDCVKRENVLSYPELLNCNLRALRAAGVDGVMVDVWWGIVEAEGPKQYNWAAYRELFDMIRSAGLKVQAVMSFHQCGGNTGDSCYIPLPPWVLEVGEECPDIYFTNQDGKRNQEYLSFGIDEEPVLKGRTGRQVYYDFMKSFRDNLIEYLDAGLVTEIEVGLGPAGELRYPSYPETHGWRFPGIGEFQCYDKFLLAQLRHTAESSGCLDWGLWGPHDAGRYNDWPDCTGFFGHSGSFNTEYGRFFLSWYSSVLLKHGDRILEDAAEVFAGSKTKLAAKVAGVHWWYNSKNHAAELAAGYYNLRERDGYRPIAQMLSRHHATLNFTCVEMRNDEQHWEAQCGPEGLVNQVLNAGWQEGLEVACENALPRYDWGAFDKIVANARPDGIASGGPPTRRISAFTFLRLGAELLQERHWNEFVRFVRAMHAGQDYHPEPEQFWRPRSPVRRSKPAQAVAPDSSSVLSTTAPMAPPAPVPESESQSFFSRDAPHGGLGVQLGDIPAPRSTDSQGADQLPAGATSEDLGFGRDEEGALVEEVEDTSVHELEVAAQLGLGGGLQVQQDIERREWSGDEGLVDGQGAGECASEVRASADSSPVEESAEEVRNINSGMHSSGDCVEEQTDQDDEDRNGEDSSASCQGESDEGTEAKRLSSASDGRHSEERLQEATDGEGRDGGEGDDSLRETRQRPRGTETSVLAAIVELFSGS